MLLVKYVWQLMTLYSRSFNVFTLLQNMEIIFLALTSYREEFQKKNYML